MAEKKETKKTTAKKPAAKKATTTAKAAKPKKKVEDASKSPVIAPELLPEARCYEVCCSSVLNVREGSGKEHRVVRQIKNGLIVTVYEQANGFGRIGDGEWVMMDFLK